MVFSIIFQEVMKLLSFEWNKLYFGVSDGIHVNEHTKHANCGLDRNFWNFLLMQFGFMMKKDDFKQNLFLWSQVSLKPKCAEFGSDVNFFSFTPEIPFFEKFRIKTVFLIWSLVSVIWVCGIYDDVHDLFLNPNSLFGKTDTQDIKFAISFYLGFCVCE